MKIGKNIMQYRKRAGLTQQQLAEKLDVSFQTVSAWERDDYLPQLEKLEKMSTVLHASMDDLCREKHMDYDWQFKDMLFSIDHMHRYIRIYAQSSSAQQTAAALPYAEEKHEGQYRKGAGHIPYIYHPLLVTCHAIALGFHEDSLTAAALLHDVCEDCYDESGKRIQPEDLPVGKDVQEAVRLLTKPEVKKGDWEKQYYQAISENRIALIVKVLDRCNNLSLMASGFTREKMAQYITETETYIMPLLEIMKKKYDGNAAFLLKYQMLSSMENLKRML